MAGSTSEALAAARCPRPESGGISLAMILLLAATLAAPAKAAAAPSSPPCTIVIHLDPKAAGSGGAWVAQGSELRWAWSTKLGRPLLARAAAGWHGFAADLSQWSGREVELGLALELQGGADGHSGDTRLAWGEPVLLGSSERAAHPSVVLVTLDTLRADHVGGAASTPSMAALAARGIVFDSAWSTANSTAPSDGSIMTGLHVEAHGALSNRSALGEENLTLAERFRTAGYRTAAAVSVRQLGVEASFGQGFDLFRNPDRRSPRAERGKSRPPCLVRTRQLDPGGNPGRPPLFVTTLRDFGYRAAEADGSGGRPIGIRRQLERGAAAIFALDSDPGLARNLSGPRPDLVAAHRALVSDWRFRPERGSARPRPMSEEDELELRAFGYIE